ncbi:basic proline-rich protein-like [Calypte anna]|uniref:basic proline-rich protein-like n=1 Tax=Calypte anna TaxID=9244 RepID=UPI0011C3D7ED|nr:basic proline-rich protein-like [Calypte anna]
MSPLFLAPSPYPALEAPLSAPPPSFSLYSPSPLFPIRRHSPPAGEAEVAAAGLGPPPPTAPARGCSERPRRAELLPRPAGAAGGTGTAPSLAPSPGAPGPPTWLSGGTRLPAGPPPSRRPQRGPALRGCTLGNGSPHPPPSPLWGALLQPGPRPLKPSLSPGTVDLQPRQPACTNKSLQMPPANRATTAAQLLPGSSPGITASLLRRDGFFCFVFFTRKFPGTSGKSLGHLLSPALKRITIVLSSEESCGGPRVSSPTDFQPQPLFLPPSLLSFFPPPPPGRRFSRRPETSPSAAPTPDSPESGEGQSGRPGQRGEQRAPPRPLHEPRRELRAN